MAEATDGAARNRLAFDRAVRREREAIVLHERAAAMHEAIAARLTEAARTAVDLIPAGLLREHAAAEDDLANVARARAAGVRARLTAEGVADLS
jgi:hypothetical protein